MVQVITAITLINIVYLGMNTSHGVHGLIESMA